ncbi:MAG: metal ABC transporter ATP-binding protein [Alphaproteobacteria bacterium]
MAPPLALSPGEPLIEASALGMQRGGRWLVHDVNLRLAAGELVTLIGPNGSGKTTLVRLLAGVMTADTGKVTRRAGLRVGYMPQRMPLDWSLPLSVRRLMTLTRRHPAAAISAALDEVAMGHMIDERVQALSGGELQRVLLARALIGRPDLLILDEPVQGVDFTGEIALYDLIGAVRQRTGCAVLMVSHDLHLVMAQTDRVICLNGHICCIGRPQEVTRDDEFRRLFGPRAADVLAVYRHHHDHVHHPDGSLAVAGAAAGDPAIAPPARAAGGHTAP